MTKAMWAALMTAAMAGTGLAQDFVGPDSVGSSNEQLYPYDDQEKWKHGYLKEMPYYHGFHSFRPYNYHHVYSQSQTAAGWGMNPTSPYSQQFWHKYQNMASPGSPMMSQADRQMIEQQMVYQQLQQQAQQQFQVQNQYNGTSHMSGFGAQQQAFEDHQAHQPPGRANHARSSTARWLAEGRGAPWCFGVAYISPC